SYKNREDKEMRIFAFVFVAISAMMVPIWLFLNFRKNREERQELLQNMERLDEKTSSEDGQISE
ncbi:MAG: hypothetical protein RSD39_08170, partial [Oscillospiraceae bacterium]